LDSRTRRYSELKFGLTLRVIQCLVPRVSEAFSFRVEVKQKERAVFF
jgi:hypothetical protein